MNVWSPEIVESLRAYWAEGLSAGQTARRLGQSFTRNMVIGKLTRLGLTMASDAPRRSYSATPKERSVPTVRPVAQMPAPPVDEPAPLLEPDTFAPEGQCKWPHGETNQPGWVMCGHPAHKPGSPWCSFRHARAYDKPRTKAASDKRAAKEADALQTRMARKMGLG